MGGVTFGRFTAGMEMHGKLWNIYICVSWDQLKLIYPVEFVMECCPLLESMNDKPLSSMSFEEVFHAFNHKDL